MASGLRAAGVGAGGQAGANLDIQDLPGPIRLIVRAAYGDSFGTLFLIAAVFAVVTLITVVMVKEVPLRTTIELKPQPVADVTDHPAEHVAENAQMATTAGPASAPSDSDRAALDVLNAAHEEARQVTTLARNEAERILTIADHEVAALEKRIATLRQVEADLTARVSRHLQHQD